MKVPGPMTDANSLGMASQGLNPGSFCHISQPGQYMSLWESVSNSMYHASLLQEWPLAILQEAGSLEMAASCSQAPTTSRILLSQ